MKPDRLQPPPSYQSTTKLQTIIISCSVRIGYASRNSSRRDVSFFKADRRNRLSRRKSLSTTETYYLEGGGSLELSTITAGQAKWTARWQTRIPGQRTIEAWTCLHIVPSEPAGRNSFGPPAARSKLDAGASPSALNSSRVRASRPPLESEGVAGLGRCPLTLQPKARAGTPARPDFGFSVYLLPYDDYFWAFGRRTLHCEQPLLHPPCVRPRG